MPLAIASLGLRLADVIRKIVSSRPSSNAGSEGNFYVGGMLEGGHGSASADPPQCCEFQMPHVPQSSSPTLKFPVHPSLQRANGERQLPITEAERRPSRSGSNGHDAGKAATFPKPVNFPPAA